MVSQVQAVFKILPWVLLSTGHSQASLWLEQPPSQAGMCGELIGPLGVSHFRDVSVKFLADPLAVGHLSHVLSH